MSFIKQTTGQAREVFDSMPIQSRIITVMLIVAIAIGLAFLVRGGSTTSQELLFGGKSFDERELDAIELAFSAAGLNEWHREGRRIRIPSEGKSQYLAALQNAPSLPLSLRSKVEESHNATSVFDSDGFREAREMHAKEQDLGNKIMAFPDVRWASVEYDRGERRGLGKTQPQAASVLVQPEGTAPLTRGRVLAIKELIRYSYAGMSSDDVVVIDTNSSAPSALADDEDPLLRKQRETEAWFTQKIRSLLSGYPARVEVFAEIDPTMDTEKTTLKFDAEPTNLATSSRKVESTTNVPTNRGVPGAVPNAIGNRAASLDNTVETSRTKEDVRNATGVAGQQYEESRTAPLQIRKIRVSVGLPESYYDTIYRQDFLKKNPDKAVAELPPMSDEELVKLESKTEKEIRSAVTVVLPELSAGADPDPLVTVWKYPDLPAPPAPEPETAKLALTWLAESWQTMAMIGLAIVALLVARSAIKGTGDSPPSEFAEGFGLEIPTPPPEPETDEDEGDSMTITGGSLKEELLELVEENPEVAANVIRSWVGEAA